MAGRPFQLGFHPGQFEWQMIAIGCSFLVSEIRFRTKIALPIATLGLNLLMNQ
jgi:hypothetical protein